MNRRILLQVTAPAMVIGLLLLSAGLAGAWYTNRLQKNLTTIRRESNESVKVAQSLEIRLRTLRFHVFLYLMDPTPLRLKSFEADEHEFEEALDRAERAPRTAPELLCLEGIRKAYDAYRKEIAGLRTEIEQTGRPIDFRRVADQHPVARVVPWCEKLLHISEDRVEEASQESDRVSSQAQAAMLLLGICGPISGLIFGYGIARGLTRSIYQLSVRVQDMAQRLDRDVASVTIAADGDLRHVDRQLQQVVQRVEEVAERAQQQQREMLRAEQLSAVGQLAASVAHEVRNPLTSVKLLVEAALRDGHAKPLTREDLNVIHDEVVRLERTVQDFLDFARLPTPRRRIMDLREVLSHAVELVRARARQQNVDIIVRSPETPVVINVDRDQISTVLVNLFLNALDAMPHVGRLAIELEAPPGDTVRLRIKDTGPGIAPEIANRLFTPFVSSKPTGTGLGLSISRRIIEEHGGEIREEGGPGGGACFVISLCLQAGAISAPVSRTGAPESAAVSAGAPYAVRFGRR
jgi:two-component system, NtrC family, sensor histidine kinase HydH